MTVDYFVKMRTAPSAGKEISKNKTVHLRHDQADKRDALANPMVRQIFVNRADITCIRSHDCYKQVAGMHLASLSIGVVFWRSNS